MGAVAVTALRALLAAVSYHAAGRKLITEQQLHSVEEAAVAFELAGQRRKVRGTNRNKQSSRSHMLYVFRIRRTLPKQYQQTQQQYKEQQGKNAQRQQQQRQQRQVGGSRRVGQREARRRETESINKSLLALTSVLTHLSQARPGLPPYRRSLLTRLLQPCLEAGPVVAAVTVLCCSVSTLKTSTSARPLSGRPRQQDHSQVSVVVPPTLRFSALTRRIRMEYHPLALLSPTQPNPSTIAHSFLSLIIPLFVSPRYSAMTRRIRMDYRPSILSTLRRPSMPLQSSTSQPSAGQQRPALPRYTRTAPHGKKGDMGQKGVRTGVKRREKEEQGEKVEEEVRVVVEEREEKGLEERSREGGKGSGDEGGGAAEMLLAAGGAVDALLGAGVDVSSESGSSDCDGGVVWGKCYCRKAAAVACEGEAAGEAVLEWYNGYGDYSDKENANSDYAVTTQAHVEQMGLGVCAAATGAAAAAAAFDPSYLVPPAAVAARSRGDGEEEGDADEGEGVFGEAGICLKQVEKGEGWRKMDPKGHRVIAGEDGAAENAKGNLGNRKKLKERAVVLQRWLAMAYVCFSSQDGVGAVL
ncbi:unnamed protein product [Closterium sp. NIES-64]|nr:unnamed protein product [Closterium sp. NIES-64]